MMSQAQRAITAVIQLLLFALAALVTLPLAFLAWMNVGFCGVKGPCFFADLPLLLPIATLLCFASFRWGRALSWILAVLALIALHDSRIFIVVASAPVLLQLGDYRPFWKLATA